VFFFQLNTVVVALMLFGLMIGATAVGHLIGRSARDKPEGHSESFGVMQGAMLGFMGLVLAFGLSLAVGRDEDRRAAVVAESDAIGTAYLRAQTLEEPVRSKSIDLLRQFTDHSIRIARTVPASAEQDAAVTDSERTQRELWSEAGDALQDQPTATATRLYVESLNESFDSQSRRIYGLDNRVPTAVLVLEVVGAAIALGLLALHLAALGRGLTTVLVAAVLVALTLVVTLDLDRPVRGLIQISATPLIDVRASMALPPASGAP
jgi:hypothetical protein